MAARIQVRRDLAATWSSKNPVLLAGEYGFETDTGLSKIGDGVAAWNALDYLAGGGGGGGVTLGQVRADLGNTSLVAGDSLTKTYDAGAGTITLDVDTSSFLSNSASAVSSQTERSKTIGFGEIVDLTIPTYDTSGEATHPSVVAFDRAWNGFTHWMAFTPYPSEDPAFENPSILASNDGITWVVPSGLTNPIEAYPGALSYNSDTHLAYASDGYLYCFWRQYNNAAVNKEQIYYRRSLNGTTWGDKTLIWETNHTVQRLVSPSLIEEPDGSWRMYAVDIVPSPNTIVTSTATALDAAWEAATTVTGVSVGAGRDPWHLDAHRIGGEYVLLVDDATLDASGTEGDLYRAVSRDGESFVTDPDAFAAAGRHYRSSFLPAIVNGYQGYEVYYSTIDSIKRGFVIVDGSADAQDSVPNMTAAIAPSNPFVFGDDFSRADSASTAGESTSGTSWSAQSGTWGVSSGALYVTSDTNGKIVADLGASDVEFGFTVKTPPPTGGSLWIMARVQDTNNYWRIGNESATWKIQSIESGAVASTVSSAGRNLVAGDRLRVVCNGTSIEMYVNGFKVATATSATFQAETEFGVQSSRTATRVVNAFGKVAGSAAWPVSAGRSAVHAESTLTKLHGPITQAAYDALTPASDTLYVIVG